MSETETEVAALRRELARAQEAIEKLQSRIFKLETWLHEVQQPDGRTERNIHCNYLCVHPPGQPAGMRWELSAGDHGTVLVLHSGAGEELLQIADTPDGRGPLMTFLSHDGTQTVQLGAGPHGGGVVRVANEEGTGLILLTTDGDAARIGVAHAKNKTLAAIHTQGAKAGLEVHNPAGQPIAVVQSNEHGGLMGILDTNGHERVTLGINAAQAALVMVIPPVLKDGVFLFAGPDKNAIYLNGPTPDSDRATLTAGERQVALDFWSQQKSVMRLGTCWDEMHLAGTETMTGFEAAQPEVARGALLRLSGTNGREIELNPLEAGRQFVLFGEERLPLMTLGAARGGVEFVLNDEIGIPKLQLIASGEGGAIFAHDADHAVAATLPPDVEFDQDGEDGE